MDRLMATPTITRDSVTERILSESVSPGAELDSLERKVLDHVLELYPTFGVARGLHAFDGRLPSLDVPSTDRWAADADQLLGKLRRLPDDRLPEDRRVDRLLLELMLEDGIFDVRDWRIFDLNPMVYTYFLQLTPYMIRNYAPFPQRVEAMASILDEAPAYLAGALRRLQPKLPEPFVRIAMQMGEGLITHFGDAERLAASSGPALGERIRSVRHGAEAALRTFVSRLATEYLPQATPDFALGPVRFQKLLWVREGLRKPYSELLATARADLRRNQARLRTIAESSRPPVELKALFERQAQRHPTADQLLPRVRTMVVKARQFVKEKRFVSLPEPSNCRVEDAPPFDAMRIPSINTPGPFEAGDSEATYYVPVVDRSWPVERQEEWLRTLNDDVLMAITQHETYPGHYLQSLHHRQQPLSLVRKAYHSQSFAEGWAH